MIEATAILCIVGMVVLVPPILAIVSLRRFKANDGETVRTAILPTAVLIDWLLLIGWHLAGTNKYVFRWLTTPLADVFLCLSLLLLAASALMAFPRGKICTATLIVLSSWVWTEQHQASFDDGSRLSVLISRVADEVGLPPGPTAFAVVHKMRSYQARGHDDAAIALGESWTEANPKDGFNDRVYVGIAWSFLNKARHGTTRADEYVDQALVYRNEALLSGSDTTIPWSGIWTLRDLALISKAAGDISPKRRCVQYGNALNLLERRAAVIKDKQEEVSRRFAPVKDDPTAECFECLSDETQTAIEQVREEQQKYSCK